LATFIPGKKPETNAAGGLSGKKIT